MAEKISVQSVTDIITSKAGREYFTFEDIGQKRYVCFVAKLKEFCKVGSEIEADLTLGKSADDSPRLDMIYVNGKPVVSVEKKTAGRSYGKSDKELTQIRQLAEAQNRSIQAQTALNRAVDLATASLNNKLPTEATSFEGIKKHTKAFYQLLQSLTLISEAKVIHKKIEEVKGETTQINNKSEITDQQQGKERTAGPTSGEALELQPEEDKVTNAGELFTWIMKKDSSIKAPRLWVQTEFDLSDKEVITDKKAMALYQTIKKKKGW